MAEEPLSLAARLRVAALIRLQQWADARPPVFASAERALGRGAWDHLRSWTSPVRLRRACPAARIPLDTTLALLSATADAAAQPPPERVGATIIIATHGESRHTELCLLSVRAFTDPNDYEVLVVDDGSKDETLDVVRNLSRNWPRLRLICNDENRGFPAAINQGIAAARGETVVVLNNDTVVTPGWLTALRRALDEQTGLVGPLTNDSGDIGTVSASYASLEELLALAKRTQQRAARPVSVDKLSLFCAALRRADLLAVGGLDEGYGLGGFEDDDLCMALRRHGKRILLARDAFVHHVGRASFCKMATRDYFYRFEVNRRLFERKWGAKWRPARGLPSEGP